MRRTEIAVGLILFVSIVMGVHAAPSSNRLQEGLYQEEIQGNLPEAVGIYQEIIADSNVSEDIAAQAMYRLGMCYMKLQNEIQARAVLTQLTERYPGQTEIAAKARELLLDLVRIDPATLMPPDAIAYVEVGNPGKQIETLLNMLQGTPLANPLMMLGGQNKQGAQAANMLNAILNPSMLAEFKKIRGFAVGCYGFNNNPPLVALLMPGKSDAVRGLILAAIGSQGQAGEPIEGMDTFTLGKTGAVGHDNDIIIVVQDPNPLERLTWCIRQYKGLSNNPSLASENAGFSKVSRQNREQNALTVWFDVDGSYQSVLKKFPAGKVPQNIRLANGFIDFENIDDALISLAFDPAAIGCDASVHFKEGHHCLAYTMIRTPNLNREAFAAVPSEAIALASIALSDSTEEQVDHVQQAMHQLTGLDIGREVFANIEQITLFVLPPNDASKEGVLAEQVSPIANCVCVAITSHDPERTRQILTQLLVLADLASSSNREPVTDTQELIAEGKFRLTRMRGKPVYCYLDQAGKHTLLSLSREVLDRSLASIRSQESVLSGGPLKASLDQLSRTSSKVVLINGGGVVQALNAHIHREIQADDIPDGSRLPLSELLQKLAKQCETSELQFQTDEQTNTFRAKLMVHNIPSLNTLFPLIMQVSRSNRGNLFANAIRPEPADGASIFPGQPMQLVWTAGMLAKEHKLYFGTDRDHLTLLKEVTDSRFNDVPLLQAETRYYWRVDEVQQDGTVVPGVVWSFKTDLTDEMPVGWWKFDEGSGQVAHDSSPMKLDGELKRFLNQQSPWTTGHDGGAIRFDGRRGYVCIPALNLSSNTITITGWIRRKGNQDPYDGLFMWRSDKTPATGLGFGSTENELGYFWNNQEWSYECHSGLIVPDSKWVFVALVVEPQQATLYLVDDGKVSSAMNPKAHRSVLFSDKSAIGRDKVGRSSPRNFRGDIDDVRIYNRTLTAIEIEKLAAGQPLEKLDISKPCYPYPSNGSVQHASGDMHLRWSAPAGVTSYKVYFGTSKDHLDLLAELDTMATGIDTPALEQNSAYYWRVDAIKANGSVLIGPVWSFKTAKALLGWWPFDEAEGDMAADSSGAGRNGKLNGNPVWQSGGGRIKGALCFDGVDDSVTLYDEALYDVQKSITVAAWIKVNRFNAQWQPIITKGDSSWRLQRSAKSNVIKFNCNGLKGCRGISGKTNVNDQQWHHVAGVYDGSHIYLYIDGKLDNSADAHGNISTNDFPVMIGGNAEESGRFWNGCIDDVRIYSIALSGKQIEQLYNGSK